MDKQIDLNSFIERVNIVIGFADGDLSEDFKNGVEFAVDMMKSHPQADPKIRKGIWKETGEYWSEGCGMGESYGCYYACNLCGYIMRYKTPFCSNCGADMRGEQDE